MLVCHSSHTLKVEHITVRIAEGFSIYYLCVGFDSCLEGSQVVHVHNRVAHALCGQCMGDEVVRTTIEVVGCHDMIACLHNILQCVGNSGCTAGHCQSSHTTFECCHTILEHTLCRVGQATVDITCIAQSKAIGSVLRIVEHITGGLINGHGTCISSGVGLFLAYMKLQSLETIILTCTHNLIPFFFLMIYFCSLSGCKGTKFGNILQISCIIQKIYLILQPRKKIFPIKHSNQCSNRINL